MTAFLTAFGAAVVAAGFASYRLVLWAHGRNDARRAPEDRYVVRTARMAFLSTMPEVEARLISALDDERTRIADLDGVPWHKAPIPRRLHHCWAQTTGWYDWFTQVDRCPCGGIWYADHRIWLQRNTRLRKDA